jgi:hypothetical protein
MEPGPLANAAGMISDEQKINRTITTMKMFFLFNLISSYSLFPIMLFLSMICIQEGWE